MILKRWFLCCLIVGFLCGSAEPVRPTEIIFWHSFSGDLGETLNELVTTYNRQQHQFVIRPVYKGDYVSALTSFAAAFQARQAPALMQVFEVGRAAMMVPKGVIVPVESLMTRYHHTIPKDSIFPAVLSFYSQSGELQALPFNSSVPVIFYNADLLATLGYNAANFPKTWDELERLSAKLLRTGTSCAYSTAFPSWIFIESYAALHGLSLIEPQTHQVNLNHPAILQHLTRLQKWQARHYFEYGGRADEATALFTSGHCAMLSQSSGGYQSLAALVPFQVGVAALPFDPQVSHQRHANVVGGAALWVIQGQSASVYAGVADFLNYWIQPRVQQQWSQKTGYIPLGINGIYHVILENTLLPTLKIAKNDFARASHTERVNEPGPLNFLRMIQDEALEAIFAGMKTPKQAMNDAMMRANYAVMRFRQNTATG